MKTKLMTFVFVMTALALLVTACGTPAQPTEADAAPIEPPAATVTAITVATSTPKPTKEPPKTGPLATAAALSAQVTLVPPTPVGGFDASGVTEDDYVGIVKQAWHIINANYVRDNFNGVDWDAVYDEYIVLAEDVTSSEELWVLLADLVHELNDDHSRFVPPGNMEGEFGVGGNDGEALPWTGISVWPGPSREDEYFYAWDVCQYGAAADAGMVRGDVILAVGYEDEKTDNSKVFYGAAILLVILSVFVFVSQKRANKINLFMILAPLLLAIFLFGYTFYLAKQPNIRMEPLVPGEEGFTSEQTRAVIFGTGGDTVTLTVQSGPDEEPRDLELRLGGGGGCMDWIYEIISESPYIGYIRIADFDGDAADNIRTAIEEFEAEKPLDGLILDVRHNPGGNSDDASGIFADGIVGTEGPLREGQQRTSYRIRGVDWNDTTPLVVLTDGSSHSAADYFPAALKELGRATIMGMNSAGNTEGIISFGLADGTLMRLAVMTMALNDGTSLEGVGVTPDIEVPLGMWGLRQQPYDIQLQTAIDFLSGK